MRVAVVIALVLLSACASDKLALAPPPGVDLSGHWRLNVNDSDDPLHLLQTQNVDPSKTNSGSQGPGQGGRSGRGNRGGLSPNGTGFPGPTTPAVGALNAALRWPGVDVEIKQSAGVVAMISSGVDEVYRPKAGKPANHRASDDDTDGRDMPARDRGPPPSCGWDDKTLVVESGETDDDQPPFEKRYSLSDDGQRLIEVVGFKGGRSSGFTASRVWDRVDRNAPPPLPGPPVAPPGVSPSSQ
jgi:hypothetical protein